MVEHYKEVPWWWYISVLVFSFVLGLIVVLKENITLPVWAYIVSLILGIVIAPFVSTLIPQTLATWIDLTCMIIEYPTLLPLWKRHRHEQFVKDAGRLDASRTTCW